MCFAKWIKLVSGVMIATEVNYFVLDKTADPSSERETSRLWIFTGRFLACGVIYYKWKCVCVCVCVCMLYLCSLHYCFYFEARSVGASQ